MIKFLEGMGEAGIEGFFLIMDLLEKWFKRAVNIAITLTGGEGK
jgi:hypothetical protein